MSPFHYGTHYSTDAFTLGWLIRLKPFTTFYLSLQEGKFVHASRLFHSIPLSWQNCQRDSSDALESEFVSWHLHYWIDLIFGSEAVRAVNLDSITNPIDRAAIETQIRNFGQAPAQLLTEPHPPRNSAMNLTPMMYNVNKHDFSINKYHPNASTPTQTYSESSQTSIHQQRQLPLSMDSILVSNINLNRRHLDDNFDERIQQRHQSFVVTADNRYIISTGYWDKSFRVQNTDIAKITQVLYGHFDIVTCVCRSEVTIAGNCFLATGSRDCTVCIWIWNDTKGAIVDREYPNQGY
ncbi:unnamed protein product, partial [Rotaria sp. Silwood1]